MPRFGITPTKEAELLDRMQRCGLREEDLDESFVRSSGPGGQKVNRSATCVYLRHRPTGVEVKMHKERSQALNRFFARRRMCELIEAHTMGAKSPDAIARRKIRRQTARRRRRSRLTHERTTTGKTGESARR